MMVAQRQSPSPVGTLVEPDTVSTTAPGVVPMSGFQTTRAVEEFLLRAQGLRENCLSHAIDPAFAWALSGSWLEETQQLLHGTGSGQASTHGFREKGTLSPEHGVGHLAMKIPLDCQAKVTRAQKLLQRAYNAPYLTSARGAIIPQDLHDLAGNLLDSPAWRTLAGVAAAHVPGQEAQVLGLEATQTLHATDSLQQHSHTGCLLRQKVQQQEEKVMHMPTNVMEPLKDMQPFKDSCCMAPLRPAPHCDSGKNRLAADHVLEAHNQLSTNQIEDMNAFVQAALEGSVAPLSRGAVGSLARILEATVGSFMACVSAVVCTHGLVAKEAACESTSTRGHATRAVTSHTIQDRPVPSFESRVDNTWMNSSQETMAGTELQAEAGGHDVVMAADADQRERTHLLVQAHMWMMLMAQTERRFGNSHQERWKDVTKELKELLTDGAQEIRQTMQNNSAALQWRQLMVKTLRAAQHQLSVAEGNVRAKTSEACELQRKVTEMQQQLHQADVSRTAAEAAVIELVPLHLTVSQLRQRLAAEMSALARLQEEHATTAALSEAQRHEALVFATAKADMTAQVLALSGDLQVKENELALAKRRADLAESTQQLDRDEINQSKRDAYELQNEHAADLEYISQLELKRKMLEDEIKQEGEKLAKITASESTLRASNCQLEEASAKLKEAIEAEVQARKAAETLVSEYEAGMERRLRKLESEILAKDSRIHLLEVDIAQGIKELEATRAEAEKEAEMSRIAQKQLEASLEVKVLERVKEQKMELVALNEMVRKARENEIQVQNKHKTHVENLRSSAQERLDAANKSAEAAEMSRLQLQQSVATQLADANKRCHQAEAKTQALERKLDHQAKAFKMRILTLEASMKDLKQTSEDLRRQVCTQEQELETQTEELDLSQARERLLARDIMQANEAVAHKSCLVEEVEAQLALARRELSLEQTARKEAERQHSAGVDELHVQLQLEHEKLSRATERLNEIDQSTCDLSQLVETNTQQAKDIDTLTKDICDLRAANEALQSHIEASTDAHASVKLEVSQLAQRIEALSADKAALGRKLEIIENEGLFKDDDSAEGDEGSRPSSRQGSRPASQRDSRKRIGSAGSSASQQPPLLPPILRTHRSGSASSRQSRPSHATGVARPRASTCVPVRHFDDGIWIDNKCIPSGWTVKDDVIVLSDALSGGCEQMSAAPPERPQSSEYLEAHAALQAVKRAHAQPDGIPEGDPVTCVHITDPLPGTRGAPIGQIQHSHRSKNSSIPMRRLHLRTDRELTRGREHDSRHSQPQYGTRVDHNSSSSYASTGIAVVGSSPVTRSSQTAPSQVVQTI